MLNSIKINNYKIHKHLNLDLGNLTVLTGVNSSGKSSVIQALLLLRQSYMQNALREGLVLNGELMSVGLGSDALCSVAEDDTIAVTLCSGQGKCSWKWNAGDAFLGKDFLPVVEMPADDALWKEFSLFTNNFQYISAARKEPSEYYPLNTNLVESKKQLSQYYGKCELVAHFLHHYGVVNKLMVLPELIHQAGEPVDLLSQVSSWERVVSMDVKVVPEKGDKSYTLKYAYQTDGDTTPAYSPINVGFGLSYALPIVVALLAAEKDSVILIENPEAHLHESAQSELGVLIARAAQAGIQVVVETHSNHILNGILMATKRYENGELGVDRNLVKMYYMKRHSDGMYSDCEEVKIIGDGKIDHQPDGFFSRMDSDMSYLLGF